mmetsp:Transcript_19398/g.40131  ORF Transcript_19398/g.40131 Transcript_19398/m.40131 type:complete len:268 (-) Transcript_19398:1757-2560(-)
MRGNPTADVRLLGILGNPHHERPSNLNVILAATFLDRRVTMSVNEVDEVFDHGGLVDTFDLCVGVNILHAIIRDLEGGGEVGWHQVRTFGHVHLGIHTNFFFSRFLILGHTNFKRAFFFIFGIKLKQLRILVQTTIGTFEWFRFATAVNSFPCTGRSLEGSLSGPVVVNQAWLSILEASNSVVNGVVDFVSLSIPVPAAGYIATCNEEGFRFVETAMRFFVNKDGLNLRIRLKGIDESFAVAEDTQICTWVKNCGGRTDLSGKHSIF